MVQVRKVNLPWHFGVYFMGHLGGNVNGSIWLKGCRGVKG